MAASGFVLDVNWEAVREESQCSSGILLLSSLGPPTQRLTPLICKASLFSSGNPPRNVFTETPRNSLLSNSKFNQVVEDRYLSAVCSSLTDSMAAPIQTRAYTSCRVVPSKGGGFAPLQPLPTSSPSEALTGGWAGAGEQLSLYNESRVATFWSQSHSLDLTRNCTNN